MYLGQESSEQLIQAAQQGLIEQAGVFPIKVLAGSLFWFAMIYWFLIRQR